MADDLAAANVNRSYARRSGKKGTDLFSEARRMSEPCCRLGAGI
jgi:hypothetical protein